MVDESEGFGARLMSRSKNVSTSRLGRAVSFGRSAVGLASSVLRRPEAFDFAALEKLTARLGELKGLGMKVGQILSFTEPSLPPEARAILAALQRQAPASEPSAVREVVVQAFGARAESLLSCLEAKPFAVASIGQVHRAELPGVGAVAVKIRHPDIARAMALDFSTALGGLGVANTVLFGAAGDAKGLLDEARAALLAECDFRQEAASQRAFGEWLAHDETLIVPSVVDEWSTDSVLTTRWEPGLSLDEFVRGGPTQAERDRAGGALFRASVGGFHRLGLLHADPHPGNFAFRAGRVVLYDFGCVRRFTRAQTDAFADMAEALRTSQRDALVDAARRFGFRLSAEAPPLLERFARGFFAPMLQTGVTAIAPDIAAEAKQLINDKRALRHLGLPPHALFLLRLRFGLYAVLAQLGARQDWAALERQARIASG